MEVENGWDLNLEQKEWWQLGEYWTWLKYRLENWVKIGIVIIENLKKMVKVLSRVD